MSQWRASLPFCLCCFLVLRINFCHGGNTLSPGQALKDNDTITSSGGNFTLGFFAPRTSGPSQKRYVGIWYTVISQQTVVWVANRNKPVPADDVAGGSLQLSSAGDLEVLDGKGAVLWSTTCSSTNDSVAVLKDDGNLVLRSNSSGIDKWESFNNPSDTLLPGMAISYDRQKKSGIQYYRSWKSDADAATGPFVFGADPKYPLQGVLWNGSVPVWRTGMWKDRSFSGIPEMSQINKATYGFFLTADDKEIRVSFTNPYSVNDGYSRYVVTPQGQFALYVWSNYSGRWRQWWAAPVNACAHFGRCGAFGLCSEGNANNEPTCSCFRGFEPTGSGGCARKIQLKCASNGTGSGTDGFVKVGNVKPPDGASLWYTSDEESCGTLCSDNCTCIGHAYVKDAGCVLWFHGVDLVDTQQLESGEGVDFYLRVDAAELQSPPGEDHKGRRLAIILAVCCLAAILCLVSAFLLWRHKTKARGLIRILEMEGQPLPASSDGQGKRGRGSALPLFDLRTIMAATNDFSAANKLGEGGFGPVYKGVLESGPEVAVKRLSKSSRQGVEEFMNEVEVIANLQHKNLVRLLGCCAEREEKILVYEYMPNKSLDFLLFDRTVNEPLDWERRFQIVMGTARGLQYLHQESRLRVIHRDLKASNILLDERMNPRISDFGLARIFGADQTQVNTNRVVGTCGYMSPEYALEGRFSTKSDVFSFGVIVLEIVSGQKMTSFRHEELNLNLLGYAWKLWREDRAIDFLDSSLGGICNSSQVLRCINAGLLCVQEGALDRPDMSSVVLLLSSESANLPQPKPPAYSLRTTVGDSDLPLGKDDRAICSENNITFSSVEPR